MRRRRWLLDDDDDDPLAGVANFFDLGIVFALGFMVAMLNYLGLPEILDQKDMTLVKDAGTPQMEIIRKQGRKVKRYRVSSRTLGGEGTRLGTAYRLKSGEVVYIPEKGDGVSEQSRPSAAEDQGR